MSVGWIGEAELVVLSRKGCMAWIAVLLRRPEAGGRDDEDEEADLEAVLAEVGEVWALVRSWTFIEAAEPGMRLLSVGALRLEDGSAAGSPAPAAMGALTPALPDIFVIRMLCRV